MFKSQKSKVKSQNCLGFTLVETIVMITIAGIIGVILTDTITQVYRSQNKTNAINQIKQNGQTALDTIDKTIRTSDRVVCLLSNKLLIGNFYIDSVITVAKQGNFTRIIFRTPKSGFVEENGHIGVDNPDVNDETNNDNDYCNGIVAIEDIKVTRLTNSMPGTGITVVNGSFQQTPQAGYKNIITVQFDATSGQSSKTLENQSNVQFKTAVEIR